MLVDAPRFERWNPVHVRVEGAFREEARRDESSDGDSRPMTNPITTDSAHSAHTTTFRMTEGNATHVPAGFSRDSRVVCSTLRR